MINKIILLIVTALPGIIKVLIFILIEKLYSTNSLGEFSNDYYVSQLFIIITAVGLSGIVMINISKSKNHKENIIKIINTCIVFCICILPIYLLIYKFTLIYFLESFILLISMSIYLIIRHYFLALKFYSKLLIYDLILSILLTIFILNFNDLNIIQKIYIPYLVVSILFIIKLKEINLKYLDVTDLKQSFHISLTNFFSGGIYFFLIPLSNKTLGIEYSALMGMILTISSIIILFPRAFSTYYLPNISIGIEDKIFSNQLYRKMLKINYLTLIVLFLFTLLLLFFVKNFLFANLFTLNNSELLYILLMFSVLVSQLSLVPSNFIMVLKKNEITFKINALLSLIYILGYLLCSYFFHASNMIYVLLLIIIVGNFIRFVILNNYTKGKFNE
jgi:O-antigen/teichoic acid export membrane protein